MASIGHRETLEQVRHNLMEADHLTCQIRDLRAKHGGDIEHFKQTIDTSWLERVRGANETELAKLDAFREETYKALTQLANGALEQMDIPPIKWARYGTDGPKSDIDLVAMPDDKHTAEQLFLATTLMDMLASEVFDSETTTEHLLDWATYVGHHANLLNRTSFETIEARGRFDALNLQLSLQQVQTIASPEQWHAFKVAALDHVGGEGHERLRQMLENVDNFRNHQRREEVSFILVQSDVAPSANPEDSLKGVHEVQQRLLTAEFTMMINARAMAECDRLDRAIQKATSPEERDQLRLEWLANWAVVESKQVGGQLSSGAYHVVCLDEGSQRYGKHLNRILARHGETGTDPTADLDKLGRKHRASHPRDILASMLENFGFYLEKTSVVDGSKYAERTLDAARRLAAIGDNEGLTAMHGWISESHRQASELLEVKRGVSIPVRALAERVGRAAADQLAEMRHAATAESIEQRRARMIELVGDDKREIVDAYLPGAAGGVQREVYARIRADYIREPYGDPIEESKQRLQELVIQVLAHTLNVPVFASQRSPGVSMEATFRQAVQQRG